MATQKKKQKLHPELEAMEEAIYLTQHACKLARDLESNLPNFANQPDILSMSIDEIVKTFSAAREKLIIFSQTFSQTSLPHENASFVHDWPRPSLAEPTTDLNQMQQLQAAMEFQQQLSSRGTLQIGDLGGRDVKGCERSKGSAKGDQLQEIGEESSSCRQRSKGKKEAEKKTILVPAPQFGNTDTPREDGFTWRKYGQKDILGSIYPRSYYRCTHQKLCQCPAKKQVQKLDQNPNLFQVTYLGKHTCYRSSIAPSSLPPQQLQLDVSHDITQSTISPESLASVAGQWLSPVQFSLHPGGTVAPAAGNASVGPSTPGSRFGRADNVSDYDLAVADVATAMFNSGSSSNNSMEFLFHHSEDKYQPGGKKS